MVDKNNLLGKSIDFLFSKDTRKYIILFLIMGLIFRFTVANNVSVLGDEMLHGPHAMNIIQSGVINLQNQSPVWFYLTDIAYLLFGVTGIAARFTSFLFGTCTIILIYLIARTLYNKQVALIAAFFLAISAFTIRYTLMEMDITMIFFILLAFYFFQKSAVEKQKLSYGVAFWMGVAILTKPIAIPFLASFALYFLFFTKNKEERKKIIRSNMRKGLFSGAIVFCMCLPVLAYNLILYHQKGITDVLFARFFKINPEIYATLQGYDRTFSLTYLITEGIPEIFKSIFLPLDPAIFILGLLGIFLIFQKTEYKSGRFFCIFHLIPFIFLLGTSLLQTHFVSFMPLLCVCAAVFVESLSKKLSPRGRERKTAFILMGIVLIVNMIVLLPNLTSQSAVMQMRNYAIDTFEQEDIVVADARIYRGRIAWMFNDKSYIESSLFPQLLELNQNMTGQKLRTNLYFIECIQDDCGWGTIANQPEFNRSVEELVQFFEQNTVKEKVFYGGGGYNEETGEPYFAVYKGQIDIHPSLFATIYNTHDWFYYPVRWNKSDWYDKYQPNALWEVILHTFGKGVLWLAIIAACLSPLLLLREFIRVKN